MKWSRLMSVALILAACAVATFSNQDPGELTATAIARIRQTRASMVQIEVAGESNESASHARGFFVRKDLIVTDSEIAGPSSRVSVSTATRPGIIRVLSLGHYFLPYVMVNSEPEIAPVTLGDSERVAPNDSIFMLSDTDQIIAGKVTGTKNIKNTQAFLISIPINSDNKGAPIFNRHGEVIGIAAKSPDGQSAGLAWPAEVLATLTHLGEPGVGIGRGDGPNFSKAPPAASTTTPPASIVDAKPVRLNSPRPQYTEAARANKIQGTVSLRVQVDVDGSVSAVRVVRGLPDGLSEQAIDVARHTKFKPAMKDGKPVAYWVGLEISFNLY